MQTRGKIGDDLKRRRMRLPQRRALLAVLLPLGLWGCGWEPLYADRESAPAGAELRAIHVSPIANRIGQRLEFALRNALDPGHAGGPARYDLRTTLKVSRADLGIESQGLATRGKLDVYASYKLVERKNGHVLLSGTVHSANGFDISPNEYATVVAEDDARTRTVADIAGEMVARLTLLMQRRAAGARRAG
jgi:LPS-assembly lipoprotein